ncbi:hypothetical protein CLAFUW4_10220 [Fulvia fulva]|uniref:Fungal N-terminal domain-containing protein n=1 Tax=Passalora fulva TaxID=5499 RepID=A0A9Q8LEZ9_PASFU|nr:uncharacterized protein CLAFUR5_04834 [Fulvia fulva]KAK4615330.1 hypothetical protein CLAFUR4_10224 [Fulvia fulva]KAK4616953.1 hypothetical protein CLAFUR0_10222 [Fulvia fulva]UJO16188.1 hypothetical protein CLAFUR5_04834 [Fulvia fulva]WPV18746.1 hypothetical protein CLAFUW4_10220 [Fulvia fulva]WPV34080.1 hypothetical protein CLAFUW7_10220 [Fulvia fulva]
MAEPFSALTGALQVADSGASLCSTLYKHAQDVKSVKGDIYALTEDIKLVESPLKQTAEFLELEAASTIFDDEGRAVAYRAVDQCRNIFIQIRDTIQAYYKTDANGQTVFSTLEQFRHPFEADRLLALRQRLEWPKNTLREESRKQKI